MHPFWNKVLSWCINFAAKVFVNAPILKKIFLWMHPLKNLSWCTHFEEKFSLDAPILKKSFLWMHQFWRKLFSWYTHFEIFFFRTHPCFFKKNSLDTLILKKSKFFLDAPILKKSFLWMHPFWRKVFSGCTHFKEKFSLDAPILVVHGRSENSPPKSPNNNNNKKNNTFLSLICRLRRR